jgi:hypothetical protein
MDYTWLAVILGLNVCGSCVFYIRSSAWVKLWLRVAFPASILAASALLILLSVALSTWGTSLGTFLWIGVSLLLVGAAEAFLFFFFLPDPDYLGGLKTRREFANTIPESKYGPLGILLFLGIGGLVFTIFGGPILLYLGLWRYGRAVPPQAPPLLASPGRAPGSAPSWTQAAQGSQPGARVKRKRGWKGEK